MSQNWLFYTTLVNSPSRSAPTDSAEEAKKVIPDAPSWCVPVGVIIVVGVGIKIGAGIVTVCQPELAPITVPIIIGL